MAARFTLIDGIIYKRRYGVPLQRCLDPDEAGYVMREVHKGIAVAHEEQRFTSVAHSLTNGQTEVTNRTLLHGLKTKFADVGRRKLGGRISQCFMVLSDDSAKDRWRNSL
ncbi:hypothetical protein CRG98_030271 [Punica granatum]|uniref:Uncharacterized protein n=1 Tax=Punica granatum TaxID=22663 RepID=A0A2I0J008_PUNGR|nr:hypothetical protein CRG98_030271 [Punica granatum]